jgi:hypothetical protein
MLITNVYMNASLKQVVHFSGLSDDRKVNLYEEVADVLTQFAQLALLQGQDISGRYGLETKTAITKKLQGRKPWEKDNLTPLQYYAARAGSEFREFYEAINTKFPAASFPLLSRDKETIIQGGFMTDYVREGKLTGALQEEIERAEKIVLEAAKTNLDGRYSRANAFSPFIAFKLFNRMSSLGPLQQHNTDSSVKDREYAKIREILGLS